MIYLDYDDVLINTINKMKFTVATYPEDVDFIKNYISELGTKVEN